MRPSHSAPRHSTTPTDKGETAANEHKAVRDPVEFELELAGRPQGRGPIITGPPEKTWFGGDLQVTDRGSCSPSTGSSATPSESLRFIDPISPGGGSHDIRSPASI